MGKPTALPSSVPVVLPPQAIPHTTIPPKPTPRIQEDLFLGSSPAMADKPVSPAPTNVLPAQLVQLRALCAFGFLIAKADGRIAQAERKVIRDALADRYGHNPDLLRRLDVTMEQVEKESPIETDCMDELRTHFDRSTYPDLIELAHTIAQASSGVNSREEELLARLRREFNLPEEPAAAPTFTHPANTSTAPASGAAPAISPQEILEIDPTVPLSPDLIRRKYTLLSERLDPTRAATLGAEFAKLAEEKRLALKAAAEQLIAPFGEPLVVEKAPQPADLRHNPDLDDVFGL
jgi:uncharacterized tellurite resistance protein B-like protein